MIFIDSHVHLDGLTPAYWRLADYYGVRRLLVSHLGIGEADFTCDPDEGQLRRWNDLVLKARRERPGRIEGLCYVNPRLETAAEEVRRCLEAGMVGVKLWVSVRYDDRRVESIARLAGAAGVPVLLHSWRKSLGQLEHESTPDEVAYLARRLPEVNFIMAHAGGDWQYGLRAVASLPNVSVDLACSVIDEGLVEAAVAWLGAERVLWGSDAPASALSIAVGKLVAARLPRRMKERVAWKNAAQLYGLSL